LCGNISNALSLSSDLGCLLRISAESPRALDLGDIRYHDIRRHAASSLIELGIPLHIVSLITGHRNINILHNIYQKLDMENFDINDFTPVTTKPSKGIIESFPFLFEGDFRFLIVNVFFS
jgi:hypothetical protein